MGDIANAIARAICDPQKRILALEASLRDCLHLLDTAEGYICTDKAQFREWTVITGPYHNEPNQSDWLTAAPGTYFRQTFSDTEAVKRARRLVDKHQTD